MPELLINSPDGFQQRLYLDKLRITIGRAAVNDVCIPDPMASRIHAEVRREGNQYVLQDLGSANGTSYEGASLTGQVVLTPGGLIKIGDTLIIYSEVDESLSRAADFTDPLPERTAGGDLSHTATLELSRAVQGFGPDYYDTLKADEVVPEVSSSQTRTGTEFYVVGGTLRPQAPSYIERRADRELCEHLLAGDICYVLTPRQMGKSSLMVHTARQIQKRGIVSVFVDLTLIGSEQGEGGASKWYYGIANTIVRALKLKVNLKEWWVARAEVTALQRLTEFFYDLVLAETREQIVVFVDEIDTTISLPFTDDFFAAIRACYNSRALQSEYDRLSFVLLGVASPSDLIKDQKRTPFNIGHGIHLEDFSFEEAKPLAGGLSEGHKESMQTLGSVLGWTGGHPYLTQKLCKLVAEAIFETGQEADVDRLVEEHFLSQEASREEPNLNFVRDRLTKDKESLEILTIYEHITQGHVVKDNPLSAVHSALKLSGLVVADENLQLRVRNRIYEHVFTESWTKKIYRELYDDLSAYKELSSDLLALISKVGVTLLAAATLDETLRQVALLVFDAVPAERCIIMLRDDESGEVRVRAAETRDRRPEVGEVRVSRNIIDEVVIRSRAILTSDAQHDPRVMSHSITLHGIRSVLAVPLGVGDRIFGLIYADSPLTTSRFTEDHLKVLTTLGSVAAIRVETARLREEEMQRERLDRELRLASEIQQRFLPAAPPLIPGYQLVGNSLPSYEIGGDYYDFIERPNGHLIIALGGVSGKGTAAALLMSSLHAAVHAQVASQRSIVDTILEVNRYLAENIPANRFVTLFYAQLNQLTGSLAFINAGHNPPLIAHADGTLEKLSSTGLPLGIFPNASWTEGTAQLHHGDVLVAYSDGVTELQNPAGEEFAEKRLQEVLSQNIERSAAGIRDKIEGALTKFAHGTPASDDITLVILKRVEPDPSLG